MNKNYASVPHAVDYQFLLHFPFIPCETFFLLFFVTLPLRNYPNQKRGKIKARMGLSYVLLLAAVLRWVFCFSMRVMPGRRKQSMFLC